MLGRIRLEAPPKWPGSLLPDGSRVPGTRPNADGSVTRIYNPGPATDRSAITLGAGDRWHELPDGRIQLIRGSTLKA